MNPKQTETSLVAVKEENAGLRNNLSSLCLHWLAKGRGAPILGGPLVCQFNVHLTLLSCTMPQRELSLGVWTLKVRYNSVHLQRHRLCSRREIVLIDFIFSLTEKLKFPYITEHFVLVKYFFLNFPLLDKGRERESETFCPSMYS